MSFQEEIVRIKLDSTAFEKELAALQKKPEVSELKVKAKLIKASVTDLIRSFETLNASVNVTAKIADLKALQTSLDGFKGKITVDAIVDFTKAVAQIDKFRTSKRILIETGLASDSVTSLKAEVKNLTESVLKTIKLVVDRSSYQQATAKLEDLDRENKTVTVTIKTEDSLLKKLATDIKNLDFNHQVEIEVNVDDSKLQKLTTDLNSLDRQDKTVRVDVDTDDTQLKKLVEDIQSLDTEVNVNVAVNVEDNQLNKLAADLSALDNKTVKIELQTESDRLQQLKSDLAEIPATQDKTVNLKVDRTELTEVQKKLEDLDRPRSVELTVGIQSEQIEFKDVSSDVAAQISKSIDKAQKGLARKTPVTLSTLNNYVTELQAALASLKGTDNIDLFNGAIAQLQIIEKRLESIKKTGVNLDIPAVRTAPSSPKNSLDRVQAQLEETATVQVKSTLDPQSLSTVLNEIESYSPTIQVGVELDPPSVAALPQTKLPDLNPIPVFIDPALNETKSAEAIAKLKADVEAKITELKTYISNGLSSAVQEGLNTQQPSGISSGNPSISSAQTDGNTVPVTLDLQGLEGVTEILNSFKELRDFGTLKINAALDELIVKSKTVDAWVKAATDYTITIAINFADIEPEKLTELVQDIQKRIDDVELNVSLALTADTVTALKTAVAAITLDPLPLEIDLDTTKLYAAIEECIADINQKMAMLPIDLNKESIDASLATIIADIKQKEASLPINGDRTLIDDQIKAVIAYAQAQKALLVLSLNDSRFLTELEALKRRVAEDVANLAVEIKSVDATELSTEVSDAVVEGLKKISAADLNQLKKQISTAKGIATKAEKPTAKSEFSASVLMQIEKLQAAKAQIRGTGNDAVEQDLDITLNRLIAALTKLGGSLGEAQFQVEKSEKISDIRSQNSDSENSQIKNLKSEISKDVTPKTVDLYKNMGMDATPEIQNLATQIARLVAVNKGLGDVWNDSMMPPVFTQGSHNQPLARGAAFKDGSGIVLRGDVAEFLTGTEGAFKDSFETVVHEIVHVMQGLAKKLGREIEYDTKPQNAHERQIIAKTESHPFYKAQNEITGGQTFKNENMANLTAYRESAQIAEQLGITLYSAIDPAKKLAARLKALDTAAANVPKIAQRVAEIGGAKDAIGGAEFQIDPESLSEYDDPWLSGNTPESKRTTDTQNATKSSNTPMSSARTSQAPGVSPGDVSSPQRGKRRRSSTLTTEELTEKLGTVNQSFYKFEQDYKDTGNQLKKAKAKSSKATPEEIQDLIQKGENLAKRKAKLTEKRRKLEDLIEAAERYYGNTTETNNRNRTKKTDADVNLKNEQATSVKNRGQAQANKINQQAETERARTAKVINESEAVIRNKDNKTEQDRLDAIQNRKIELALAGLKAKEQELKNDLKALKNAKQSASNQAQIVKDKKAIELQLIRINEALVKLETRRLKLSEARQISPEKITQAQEKTKQAQERTKQAVQGTTQALTRTEMLEEKLRQLIAKGAGGSSGGGGGGGGSTNVAGASGDMPDEDAVAQFRARVAQIQAQLVQEAQKQLTAAQTEANTALDVARREANNNATRQTIRSQNLDVQLKLLRVDQAKVALAQRQLNLAESSAMSQDKIDRSRYALLQAQQRLAAAELRVANSRLDSQLKAQRLTINEQRIAAGVRREQRELAPRSYGATGGSKSQINAERRLPINLGLNILEASNNTLGNLARVLVDLQEGIQSASLEGETFAETFNRIKTPITIIGIVGAMASLVAITAPAVIAIQKLEKSLTAFGKQDEFADSLKVTKKLATEYGASLTIVASELARFKTSLADSSIADQSDSIFESLVKYGTTVGASQDELSRGLVALGQIASKGKVSLEELNGQLSEAIPGASSIAAKALGITKAELFDMAQAGSLLSDDFLPKFRDELERVNKAQEAFGKNTLAQAFGKLKESLILQGLEKTTGAIELLTSAVETLANFANNGIAVPFNLLGESGLQLSTIINASVTASFIYLMAKAQPLLRILKLLQIPFLINARNTAILTDRTIGLTLAQRQAYISSMSLRSGLKAMVASAAPMIALFAAIQVAFGVFKELDGGDLFKDTNKQFAETAENVKKLKVTMLKNLADIRDALDSDGSNDAPNPFQNISRAEQKTAARGFKQKDYFGKRFSGIALDYQRIQNMFRGEDDPRKTQFQGNFFTSVARYTPFSFAFGKQIKEKDEYDRNANVNAIRQVNVENLLEDAREANKELSKLIENQEALEQLAAKNTELNNLDKTLSTLGLVTQTFESGKLAAEDLQATLLRIGVPEDLIPMDLGQGINNAAQDSRELDQIFAALSSRKDVLKEALASADPEIIRAAIEQLEIQRQSLEKTDENYREVTEEINFFNTALRIVEKTLAKQKVAQDKVNEALTTYNSIKAENDGVVDLATTLAEVALKQEALNQGVISNSSLSLQNANIKARAHTATMAQLREQRKALDALTMNLRFEDAFKIMNAINDDSLFKPQEDGTISFAISKASVTQLDKILLDTEGQLTDSVKKSIEAFKADSSNLNLAYAQQQSSLLDIQLETREQVSQANKDFAEAMDNFGSETKELTKSFIETFADGIMSINREITDLSNDLKKLKITNAGKQFDNALRRFTLNATGDLDESVLENIRLRNEIEVDSAIAEIDFQSEADRIANSFADGVSEISKAFADYLNEFKKLQQDLIKARQEQAKATGTAANITPDLSSFDQTGLQLNQQVGESVKTNTIPDSQELIEKSENIGKEAKKQTEIANQQLAKQTATQTSVDVQTSAIEKGHATIVDTIGMDIDSATTQLAVLIQMRNLIGKAVTAPAPQDTPGDTNSTTSLQATVTPGQGLLPVPKNANPLSAGGTPLPPPPPNLISEIRNQKSDRDVSSITALRRAIIGNESTNNFTAVNDTTGAMGYGQITPENLPKWTREALGRSMTKPEFLANPQAQIKTIEFKLKEFLQKELNAGFPLDMAVRRVASVWYSGDASLYNNTKKQGRGKRKGKDPSIDEYTKDILSRFKTEKTNLKTSSDTEETTQASAQNEGQVMQFVNQKVMGFTEALDVARQISAVVSENSALLKDRANTENEINNENFKGTSADIAAKKLQIAENNKPVLEGAEEIAEAIKPQPTVYQAQAKENLKDRLSRLESLQEAIAPAQRQIDKLENTVSELFANDNPLLFNENGSLKEGAEYEKAQKLIETQIAEILTKVKALKGNDDYKQLQQYIDDEKKITDALLKTEEYALRRADLYKKQADALKVEQKIESAKFQLEDPNINPVQKIETELNLKTAEQLATFGDRVKATFDKIKTANPGMDLAEAWQMAEAQIKKVDEMELNNLKASVDSVTNRLKTSLRDTLVGILDIDFADKSKSLQDKIFEVFNSVLKNLQSWAAGKLGEVLMAVLNKGSSDKEGAPTITPFSRDLGGAPDTDPYLSPGALYLSPYGDNLKQPKNWATFEPLAGRTAGFLGQTRSNALTDLFNFGAEDALRTKTLPGFSFWSDIASMGFGSNKFGTTNAEETQLLDNLLNSKSSGSRTTSTAKASPLLGLASSALGAVTGGWGNLVASVFGSLFADGGLVGATGFNQTSSIASLLETERIKSNGKTPILAALHMGEHVLSTKNKDAQAFQAMQQNGVWDAVKSASGYSSGGSVGLMSSNMRMNQLFKSDNSQTKTITNVSNFNFTATNDQLIQRTEAQIQARKNSYL